MTHSGAEVSELAVRVAEYLRGSLAIGRTEITEIVTGGRTATFFATALDGQQVMVTVEDKTDA